MHELLVPALVRRIVVSGRSGVFDGAVVGHEMSPGIAMVGGSQVAQMSAQSNGCGPKRGEEFVPKQAPHISFRAGMILIRINSAASLLGMAR